MEHYSIVLCNETRMSNFVIQICDRIIINMCVLSEN